MLNQPKSPPFAPLGPVDLVFANSMNLVVSASPLRLPSSLMIAFAAASSATTICLAFAVAGFTNLSLFLSKYAFASFSEIL